MLIASPGDPMEVRACMRFLINNPQPSYLRLTKAAEPSMHLDVPNVEPGVWLTVKKRFCTDTFLTTGGGLGLVFNQIDGRRELDKLSVHSLPLWSMRCKGMQPFQVNNFEKIITVEDHLVDGGFGSWLVEALLGSKESLNKIDVRALGSDVCGMVGSANALISKSNFWGNVK
jgi:transketolase